MAARRPADTDDTLNPDKQMSYRLGDDSFTNVPVGRIINPRLRSARDLARRSLSLITTATVAILLLSTAPQKIRWSTLTPYTDTLSRLVSSDHTNGRFDLWRVAITMMRSNPLWGTGAGNFAIEMRRFVEPAGVDAKVFGFLRNDLPLFNDYLQAFVETGIIGGIAFLLIFVLLPAVQFFRYFKKSSESSSEALFAFIACTQILLASAFDYPLIRSESILLLALLAGYVAQSHSGLPNSSIRLHPLLLKLSVILLILIALPFGTSYGLRWLFQRAPQANYLKTAFLLWPWDSQWNNYHARIFEQNGDRSFADKFVASRLKSWPLDPLSHLSQGDVMWIRGDTAGALQQYQLALREVPGGRCNPTSYYTLVSIAQGKQLELAVAARTLLDECAK